MIALPARAQEAGQKTYASPEEASQAIFAAAQKNDEKAMIEILGKDGKGVVESGDAKEDAEMRANFVAKFQVMHRLVEEPDATTTLYVGAENWPAPIPLVNRAGKWYFDTEAAKKEILFRRVGKNELSTIRVCQELVASQKEFAAKNGGEYASKFVADAGKQNGLYWPATDGQAGSPIGPLVANAGSEGGLGKDLNTGAEPFRGYFFRILDRQGKKATGGAMSYIADGKMTKGFAFVAYPAAYRDSGVMTFLVSSDGIIYEKDLGKQTIEKAKSMKSFDPDTTWQRSEAMEQQSADNK
ncbi:MAG TPA: DUF2950 domain-containing protein [Candidatus Acidoferrales bacterium]